jgi:LacI family transcriptional regulator
LVFFDRHCTDITESSKVIAGDYDGAYKAVEHLINRGCKKIAHFAGPQKLELYKNRLLGYKTALIDNGLSFEPDLVVESSLLQSYGYDSMKKLHERNHDIDGIFSANDAAAVGAMKFLKSLNIKVPDDIAFVGFSNDPLSEVIEPALTTVDQFGFEMGRRACELLINNIKNKGTNLKGETIILTPELIPRASSQKN